MTKYLAIISVLGEYHEPEQPPGIWGGAPVPVPTPPIYYPPGVNVPVFPTHPIAPGGSPPGIWGGSPAYPAHPIAPGGGPSQGPGFPTNPIAPRFRCPLTLRPSKRALGASSATWRNAALCPCQRPHSHCRTKRFAGPVVH